MNAVSPFVYLWGDIINHKNVAARVNVTGVDPSRSGFEPGSRCLCERGDGNISVLHLHVSPSGATCHLCKMLQMPSGLSVMSGYVVWR